MIWNYNNPFPYCVRGTNTRSTQIGLQTFCERYGIDRNSFRFNSDDAYYNIEFLENNHCRINISDEPGEHLIIDPFDFVRVFLFGTEKQWYDDLRVGDTVIIEDKGGCDFDYPYSFSDEMKAFNGKSYMISRIHEKFTSLDTYMCAKFFNGDFKMYTLEDTGYYWHSSMFSPKKLPPIKQLNLTSIDSFNLKFTLY